MFLPQLLEEVSEPVRALSRDLGLGWGSYGDLVGQIRGELGMFLGLIVMYKVVPQFGIAKLVHITSITIWFMMVYG